MKSSAIVICLWMAGCGGTSTTNGATCGAGTTLVNGQCVVAGGGAGGGAAGSDSQPEAGAVGGQAGSSVDSGTVSITSATQITWMSNWIGGTPNPFGIEGWIWSANDCETGAGTPCDVPDPTLLGPDQKAGWSISNEEICLKGTIEPITDWTKQWGADLGINLTADGKTPYDASKLKGFLFDITGTAPGTINIVLFIPNVSHNYLHKVQVPSNDASAVFAGPDAVTQGPGVSGVDKVPFDPSQLLNISFVPVGTMGLPTPYDFCVRNFRVLE